MGLQRSSCGPLRLQRRVESGCELAHNLPSLYHTSYMPVSYTHPLLTLYYTSPMPVSYTHPLLTLHYTLYTHPGLISPCTTHPRRHRHLTLYQQHFDPASLGNHILKAGNRSRAIPSSTRPDIEKIPLEALDCSAFIIQLSTVCAGLLRQQVQLAHLFTKPPHRCLKPTSQKPSQPTEDILQLWVWHHGDISLTPHLVD